MQAMDVLIPQHWFLKDHPFYRMANYLFDYQHHFDGEVLDGLVRVMKDQETLFQRHKESDDEIGELREEIKEVSHERDHLQEMITQVTRQISKAAKVLENQDV